MAEFLGLWFLSVCNRQPADNICAEGCERQSQAGPKCHQIECSNYKFVSLQIYLHADDDDTDKCIYLEIYLHSDDGDTDVL